MSERAEKFTRIEWYTGKMRIDWSFPYRVERRGDEIVFIPRPTNPPVWVPD